MDAYLVSAIMSYSIAIAAIAGLVRFRNSAKPYKLFIIICWLGLLNEILSMVSAYVFHNNAVPSNIYVLIEGLLYTRLFFNWGAFNGKKYNYNLLILFLIIVWIIDNILLGGLTQFNSLYKLLYSFVLVFLAIDEINRLLASNHRQLLRNTRFLISIGLVIFYTYKAIVESFYLFHLNFSDSFFNQVYRIMEVVNLLVNLIFTIAILCIPRRPNFILPLS